MRVCRRIWTRCTTGKRSLKDERVDWHTSICPQHAFCHHSLIGRLPRQTEDANVVLQGRTVRVQTVYHNKDVVTVRHNRGREISPFWLAILLQDVQLEVDGGNFLRKKVQFQWLNQTSDPLTYTPGDVCDRNSPNCILTRVLGFTAKGSSITLTSEEDNRLSRLANGDLYDEDVGDDEDQNPEDERAAGESEREVSLPRLAGVSLSGRRTTLFQL